MTVVATIGDTLLVHKKGYEYTIEYIASHYVIFPLDDIWITTKHYDLIDWVFGSVYFIR